MYSEQEVYLALQRWRNISVEQKADWEKTIHQGLSLLPPSQLKEDVRKIINAYIDLLEYEASDDFFSIYFFLAERNILCQQMVEFVNSTQRWRAFIATSISLNKSLEIFVKEAEPFAHDVGKSLGALVTKVKEQISKKLHIPPSNAPLVTLLGKYEAIQKLLDNFPDVDSLKSHDIETIKAMKILIPSLRETIKQGYENKLVAKQSLEKQTAFNVGLYIRKYQGEAGLIFELFDDLADKDPAQQQQALAEALKQIDESTADSLTAIGVLPSQEDYLKPKSVFAPDLSGVFPKKDSPTSSKEHTPPQSSNLKRASSTECVPSSDSDKKESAKKPNPQSSARVSTMGKFKPSQSAIKNAEQQKSEKKKKSACLIL